jgi:hypothetical protein
MLQWLYMHVSNACFKCFICFQMYVANVSSECFKSKSMSDYCCAVVVHVLAPEACRRLRGVHPQVGMGRGFVVRTRDGRKGAVPLCGARDGRGPQFQMLAMVGNRTERVGCDAGMGAQELRTDADLESNVRPLALSFSFLSERFRFVFFRLSYF